MQIRCWILTTYLVRRGKKNVQLHRQNIRLNSLLRQFKNSDENYLKIRYVAKQAVESVLSDNRQLLKLSLLSLIESLNADPIKFNFLIHVMPSPLTMSKPTMIEHAGNSSNYCVNHSHPIITGTVTLKLLRK